MRAELKSLHLENFKGVKDRTYNFENYTKIQGMNGLGKTTIVTSYLWLLTDKDYDLHSNPNIRPDDVAECIPTVTAVLDIGGKEVTVAKMQKRIVSKPNDKGVSKVTLTNTYTINEVPKTERDFRAYLEDLGFAFENFLVCSHPNVFTSQKKSDMRKILFKMASQKSDYDIATMSKETEDVANLLINYKYEEIEAMQKASAKKASEKVEAIPNQIIGLEKAKIDIDVAEQELAKNDLERRIAEIDNKISEGGNVIADLLEEEMQLQMNMSAIAQTMNRELSDKRRKMEDDNYEAKKGLSDICRKINFAEKRMQENEATIEEAEKKRTELGNQYKETMARTFDEAQTPYLFDESKWVFDENCTVCALCGQPLPEERIAELKVDFEKRKENVKVDMQKKLADARNNFLIQRNAELEAIKEAGFEQKHLIEKLKKENSIFQSEIEKWKKEEVEISAMQMNIEKQLVELPVEVDYSQNEEYAELKAKHNAVKEKIASMKNATDMQVALKEKKEELQTELDAVKEKIAQSFNNVRIDEQIMELQKKQCDYEQAKADAEKILYQLSLISKKKNELLVEEINKHFSLVQWQLFDYQKNGEYKEVCVPTIDGKRFGESTNTGREIEAKLDICNSFQNFFNMHVPIFLDGAESLNNCYMPKVDTQLITLSVSNDTELKVEVF